MTQSIPYTIQIPIYNETSALRFSKFYFDSIDVTPCYVLDSKCTEESRDILLHLGHEPKSFDNDKPFIENGYQAFAEASPTDWILRLDCDELPSVELLAACADLVNDDASVVAGFERYQVLWHHGVLLSAEADRFRPHNQVQWRLFNRRRVRFDLAIHTPGLVAEEPVRLPPEACAYHLAWEFLTWDDRIRKAARYDAHGQPEANRQNQLFSIADAQMTPLDAPILHAAYQRWNPNQGPHPALSARMAELE